VDWNEYQQPLLVSLHQTIVPQMQFQQICVEVQLIEGGTRTERISEIFFLLHHVTTIGALDAALPSAEPD